MAASGQHRWPQLPAPAAGWWRLLPPQPRMLLLRTLVLPAALLQWLSQLRPHLWQLLHPRQPHDRQPPPPAAPPASAAPPACWLRLPAPAVPGWAPQRQQQQQLWQMLPAPGRRSTPALLPPQTQQWRRPLPPAARQRSPGWQWLHPARLPPGWQQPCTQPQLSAAPPASAPPPAWRPQLPVPTAREWRPPLLLLQPPLWVCPRQKNPRCSWCRSHRRQRSLRSLQRPSAAVPAAARQRPHPLHAAAPPLPSRQPQLPPPAALPSALQSSERQLPAGQSEWDLLRRLRLLPRPLPGAKVGWPAGRPRRCRARLQSVGTARGS